MGVFAGFLLQSRTPFGRPSDTHSVRGVRSDTGVLQSIATYVYGTYILVRTLVLSPGTVTRPSSGLAWRLVVPTATLCLLVVNVLSVIGL